MTEAKKRLGFMYVAKKACGRVAASCWDDADSKKDTAKTVADYIKRGLTVERIERFHGDQMPEWICDECRGKPCKDSAALRNNVQGDERGDQ
jgi:hypothetical protein